VAVVVGVDAWAAAVVPAVVAVGPAVGPAAGAVAVVLTSFDAVWVAPR